MANKKRRCFNILSVGQVNDAFTKTLGRDPTGSERQQYTSDPTLDGSPGQQALIAKIGGGRNMSSPSTPGDVNGFLKNYQTAIDTATKTLNTPQQSPQEIVHGIKQQILPNQPAPTAPNLSQEYQSLITDKGVTDLESHLAALKDQENTINTQLESQKAAEEGKPVAMNVIAGRQTEEGRQAQIQLDSLARQKQAVTDELSVRYSAIDTIMKFTQQDYDNALKSYDQQYQQNLSVYQAFTQQQQFDTQQRQDAAKTILDATDKAANLQMQIQQEQKQSATANLQIYANMITNGNTSYADMTPDQKLTIQKLEVQAGLGVGFVESLTSSNPGGKVLYAGPNGAVMQMKDGSLKTVNYNISGKGNGNGITTDQARGDLKGAVSEMSQKIGSIVNSYGNINPKQWQQAEQAWTSAGFSTKDFVANFSHYADPNRGDFETAYGFKKSERSSAKPSTSIPGFSN